MLNKYLKELKKNKVDLISYKTIDWKTINGNIFINWIPKNLKDYKKIFLIGLKEKLNRLDEIKKEINQDKELGKKEKELLNKEVYFNKNIIIFLSKIYDIEANKIDKKYKIEKIDIDYDFYNNLFFWVTKKNLENNFKIKKTHNNKTEISKKEIIKLLEASKEIIPEINYEFLDIPNMYHKDWKIFITKKDTYNIKSIIALFFHEMTHLFRHLNWINNLWFNYTFSTYNDLEEGMAQYNEYLYWNQIIKYWDNNPYYDICYQIILENINKKEKQEKINKILQNKWFSKEKSNKYYERFYRYSKVWGKKLFLKDLIYTESYHKVTELIKEDDKNYEEIMKWRIWLNLLNNNYIGNKKNIDSKKFFKSILQEIKSITNI